MRRMKKWMLGFMLITALCFVTGCGNNGNVNDATQGTTDTQKESGTGGLNSDGTRTDDVEDNRVDHDNIIEDAGEGIEDLGQGVEDLGADTENEADRDTDSANK